MKLITIDLSSIYLSTRCAIELVYPYGMDLSVEDFVDVMDTAFLPEECRFVAELALYEKLSGSVPTDPLTSAFEPVLKEASAFLASIIPKEFLVVPDRVEYEGGCRFTLYWRETNA